MTDLINHLEDGTVQIVFEREYNGIGYRDAIYYSAEAYKTITADDIEAEKVRRFDNWVEANNTPKTLIMPDVAE